MTFLGSLVGFMGSYLLSPRYSARAVLVVSLPSWFDSRMPVSKSASRQRLINYLDQAFSLRNLRPRIEREGIAKAKEAEKVYREIRKNTRLQPEDDSSLPRQSADLIYTDSTPQRAERLCSVLTSAVLEKIRVDDEGFPASKFTAKSESSHRVELSVGPVQHPYGVEVVLPCDTSDTPDISHPLLCAAIGSATGLLVGIALIAVRRTSLAQLAEPRC